MADETIRTFIAIELPDDVKRGLGRTIFLLRERVATSDIKWVPANNIHVTLKFLGDVPASRIEEIRNTLEVVCSAACPMNLKVGGLGAFPSSRAPRIVWAGLQGDVAPLVALARTIDEALYRIGYAREARAFAPHLTLARVRQEATQRTLSALSRAIIHTSPAVQSAFATSSIAVMRSQLTSTGAVYSRIAGLPLGSLT
ncbi:MAG: RNA 2',3'-cyclic phosphodiesterase [Dehalococcoidia bacterium]|nr:RNA 2',3'-cyclic phosphodiesterase [Dehalococcoidia bacterium]